MATLKKTKNGFQDQLSLNAGQKYCRMLPWEPAGKIISLKIFFAHYMKLRVYTVMVCGGLVEV